MKIAIEGFYGYGNLGDEAILAGLVFALSERAPVRPVVFTRRPAEVRRQHPFRATHSRSALLRRAFEITTSRLFLLGGGGLLKDYGEGSDSLLRWLDNLVLAQRLGRPTVVACAGVENIRFLESRRRLVEAVERASDVTVRDRASRDLLRELGVRREVHVAADPALLLAEEAAVQRVATEGPPRILVALRHWYSTGHFVEDETLFDRALQAVAEATDRLVARWDARVDFIAFRSTPGDDDARVAERVIDRVASSGRVRVMGRVPELSELMGELAGCHLVIGMRLHALILAASLGVPMVGLAYMPKVASFMEGIGQQRYCMDMESVTGTALTALAEDSLTNDGSRSRDILAAVAGQRRRVEEAAERWPALAEATRRPASWGG